MRRSLKLSDRKYILLLIDLLIILCTTLFSLWIHARGLESLTFNLPYLIAHSGWLVLLSLLWIIAAYISGLYDPMQSLAREKTILSLIQSGLIVIFVYLLIFFYTAPTIILPRGIVVYQVISGFFLIGVWRFIYLQLFSSSRFMRKVIIVGANEVGKQIAKVILETSSPQYLIVGFMDDKQENNSNVSIMVAGEGANQVNHTGAKEKDRTFQVDIPIIGGSEQLVSLAVEHEVPELILALTYDISADTTRSLMGCLELGIDITLAADLYEKLTGRVLSGSMGENWLISLPLDSAETSVFYSVASRLFDIFSALLGLSILLPLFPFIALAIYLDSPGPILYEQNRIGKGGKIFTIYKLRTMIPEAETFRAIRAQVKDPRITRVGRILRKIRLDEMPQLYNILKGEMSAVGPRPERPEHIIEMEQKIPFHRLRNAVKPGMAGWAVLNFGYVDDIESASIRLEYDLYYVKHQSLMLDFVILLRTFGQILLLRGR